MSEKGFVSLRALSGRAPAAPAEILEQIRRIYFKTTKQTIENDLAHAVELLKALPDEEAREKATVYMHGLAEMRREWSAKGQRSKIKGKVKGTKPRQ